MLRTGHFFANWRSQGSLGIPAEIDYALVQDGSRKGKIFRPLADCLGNAVMGRGLSATTIGNLLALCGPSAVFWAIRAVIVDAIYGVVRSRRLTHVGIKVFKGCPALTHKNVAPTILRVMHCGWILAPVFHARPNPVDLGSRKPVCFWRTALALLHDATTLRIAQVRATPNLLCSAVANAKPLCNPWLISIRAPKNQPFAKTLASQVNEFAHRAFRLKIPNHHILG